MRRIVLTLLTVLCPSAVSLADGDTLYREVRLSNVVLDAQVAPDLREPEGKSRWHLESVVPGWTATLTLQAVGPLSSSIEAIEVREQASGPLTSRTTYSDPTGGEAAVRWLFPDRFPELLQPGARETLRIEARTDRDSQSLWIELEVVGIGWAHLPAGPRETVLQRARVFRGRAASSEFASHEVLHRWIDPRAGVVATVSGSASADGRRRIDLGRAVVVEEVLAGTSLSRIFVDEVDLAARTALNYAWARQEVCVDGDSEGVACTQDSDCSGTRATCGTRVSSLTPDAYANIGQLLAAGSWDFSTSVSSCTPGSPGCKEVVQGNVELNGAETCNADPNVPSGGTGISCGYQGAGRLLGRQDHDPDDADWIANNQVTEREVRGSDTTVWLRAGAQKEAVPGAFGAGETRLCYDPNEGKPEVALYRFGHQEQPSGDWYMQVGDSWETSFSCDQVLFSTGLSQNAVCGSIGTFGRQRAAGQPTHGACSRAGKQSGEVLKEGVVTLPSGHTVNALVVRTLADFCVYNDCSCGGLFCGIVAEVLTDTLVWQVPDFGTVALLMSRQDAGSLTDYDLLSIADIRVGHFPPLSITVGTVADTTVDLSWDPGNQTHRIDNPNGYNVYWDTVSGASSAGNYASSMTVSTPSATVSGLTAGTTYYFTVTSNATYANPSNPGVSTTYESLKYPTTVSGDPSFVYPVEVQATTACAAGYTPTSEVSGLTADKNGGGVEFCWNPVHLSEACVEGYRVLGSAAPESNAGFSTVTDVGLTSCWSGNPTETYFLSVTRASGGTGPWGHYGQ